MSLRAAYDDVAIPPPKRGTVNEPRILAALLTYLEGRNATPEQMRKYIRYWQSSLRDPSVPCPICYTFRGRHSGLAALHEKDGYLPLVCATCQEAFNVPIE